MPNTIQVSGPHHSAMPTLPKIAVCLAAFNGKAWLTEQIDSILAQENVAVTVFVSVDESSDGTESFIEAWSQRETRIVPLPMGFRFGGAAANFIRLLKEVDFSGFDYVALADQDDVWYPEKLDRAVCTLVHSVADCYSSNVMAFWEDTRQRLIDKAQAQRQWDYLFEAAGPGCTYVCKQAVLADFKQLLIQRGEAVSKIGLHDWFLYAFARARGYRWIIDTRPSMHYRQHSENQVGVNVGWRAFCWRFRKIRRGWWIGQARLIARLLGLEEDPFCRNWRVPGRFGMLWLALQARQCRRKGLDRCAFAILCLLLFVIGDRSDA